MKKLLTILAVLTLFFCLGTNATAKSINLNQTSTVLPVGSSTKLKIIGVKKSKIKWKSSKPSVVNVNKSGKIAGKKVGKATVTGTYKKIKFKCNVTVVGKNINKLLYDNSNFKIRLSSIASDGLSLKITNKQKEDVDLSVSYVIFDDEYHGESTSNEISPSNFEKTMNFKFEDTISNVNAKFIALRIEMWDPDTGYKIGSISIPKTKIK